MTAAEALSKLTTERLRFADAAQIEMVDLVALAETLVGQWRQCPDCEGEGEREDGRGECDNCGRECPYCHVNQECRRCRGAGEVRWKREEVFRLDRERILELLKRSYPEELAA